MCTTCTSETKPHLNELSFNKTNTWISYTPPKLSYIMNLFWKYESINSELVYSSNVNFGGKSYVVSSVTISIVTMNK